MAKNSRSQSPSKSPSAREHDQEGSPSRWHETTTWATTRLAMSPSPSWMAPVDWCSAPVVLRAVLWANGLALVLALMATQDALQAFKIFALTAAFLEPALGAWLAVCCLSKYALAKLRWGVQYFLIIALAVASAAGAWFLAHAVLPPDLLRIRIEWVMIIGGLAVMPLFHYLIIRQRAAVPRAQQAHLADLEQRIRPHFLFNSLNAVSALITIDPPKAEQALDDLAELFRMLTRRPSGFMLLAEEVDLAKRYLGIESLRFGERMQVNWDLDKGLLNEPVPTLCLQPLVENAVKHGVESTPGLTTIDVTAQMDGGRMMLRVINTSAEPMGYRKNTGTGTALENLRERLRLVYDIAADWEVKPEPNRFQVTLWLPL
jgi:two-component system, LytTR family, sensor histidine kinase AlgZ